jgi:carboxyl-terminal processing protease
MKSQRVRLVLYSTGLALCLFFVLERSFLRGTPPQKPVFKGFDLLGTVARLVKDDYIEERDPARTMEGACRGLVDSLDPVSSYLDRDTSAKYLRRGGTWAGTGAVLFKRSFGLFPQVAGIDENSPAEKAGIRIDDTVSAINGRGTLEMSSLEANLSLKDNGQTPVTLKIVRDSQTLEIKIERSVLHSDPFALSTVDGFSVLRIYSLYAPCASDLRKKALPAIKSRKSPVILDLRNCAEGEIEEARQVLNLFVRSPEIGHFEKKGGTIEPLGCPDVPAFPGLPSAIWTNGATMGPAELIAGTLQSAFKVKVVGTATPGLVSRQELFPLQDNSTVLITSGIFVLASGKKLWSEGITPDEIIGAAERGLGPYLKKSAAFLPKR